MRQCFDFIDDFLLIKYEIIEMAESDMKKKKTTRELLKFGDVQIEEIRVLLLQKANYVNNVEVEKMIVSNEFVYDKNKEINAKHFIRYKKVEKH